VLSGREFRKAIRFVTRPMTHNVHGFEEIRREHPRAYERWSVDEDVALRDAYRDRKTIEQLAAVFEKNRGPSVRACKSWVCYRLIFGERDAMHPVYTRRARRG
jgi:hypothetical protein